MAVASPEACPLPFSPTSHDRRLALSLFLALLLLYCATGRFFIDNIDGETMYLATHAMAQGRRWIEPELTTKLNLWPGVGGHQYSVHSVFTSVMGLPLYYLGEGIAHFAPAHLNAYVKRGMWVLGSAIYTSATAAWLLLLLMSLGCSRRRSLAVTLAWALATMAFPYAKYPFSEPLSGLLHVGIVWFAWRHWQQRRLQDAGWLGLLVGLAFLTRHANAILIPILAVYLILAARRHGVAGGQQLRSLLAAAAGLLPGALAWLWLNWSAFGHVLMTGSESRDFMTLAKPNPLRAAAFLLLSPGKGLFLYAPIMILATLGFYWLYRRFPALAVLLGSIIVAHLLFYAAWPYYLGDWCWGPRFLVDVLPLWIIPLAFVPYRGSWKIATKALVTLSFVVQLLAVSVFYTRYFDLVEQQHGTVNWAYQQPLRTPLIGVAKTAADLRWHRLDLAKIFRDPRPGEDVKAEMRSTLDFWPVYAYRLGATWALWLVWALQLALAVTLLLRVWRATKPASGAVEPKVARSA